LLYVIQQGDLAVMGDDGYSHLTGWDVKLIFVAFALIGLLPTIIVARLVRRFLLITPHSR
jgi:membrane protein implicated in regulation of membrane protease activity